MYKVFFNEHTICFCDKNQTLLKNNNAQVIEIELFDSFENQLYNMLSSELVDNLQVVSAKPDQLWDDFSNSLVQIPAAGGVVVNLNSEILFIKRLGKWDLPKGKIEKGEEISAAAIREVEEECGITSPRILRKLPSTFHLYFSPYIKSKNNLVLKETHWFEMIYEDDEVPVPQIEEDIEEVRWFKKHELDEVFASTYSNLAELLQNYLA